jgi:hypothetical protein
LVPLNWEVAGVADRLPLRLLLRDEERVHGILGIGRDQHEDLVA